MNTQYIEATYTQCKQIADNFPLRDFIAELDDQPDWITTNQPLGITDIQAIQQGGCASGAYMPAVTYYTASQTMAVHGNDVLDYIQEQLGELPAPPQDTSWSGMAVFYLSYAVELWAMQFDLTNVDWD